MTNRLLGAAGLGGLAAIIAAVGIGKRIGVIVAVVMVLLLVLLVGGYLLWQRQKRQRASRQFQSGLSQEAARAPREIKDPNRQADLDKLRKRFTEGIEVYHSRGKDLYSVPWFVIIGESGSGKTEAIRHSNLDFPSGLNDFMQGAGGTINMDWWFTNHGVILDTAGSMVFREMSGDTAGSPQWQEFLKLLKKHRPHCPINGLVLVLSVDSLISDSAARIAEKAGRIARQLDTIQRALDVRFPVSVVVTKCDKLTGFREFFEPIEDPELQDQMLGWSNPDSLDTPFRADLVDQHLEQVIGRLRKRRLGLLRDPLPTQGPRARRTDEVDALYALPKSLALIAPRLRRYLETIFVAGEFSAKPVFLRGIYFTSAMQTGADMDEAVWNALGRSTADAETSGASKRDLGRPFFLRDVFLEKVFRERGLVTRATNTRRMLLHRKLILMGTTSACLVLLLIFGLMGRGELNRQIANQSADWSAASANWTPDSHWWHPVVTLQEPAARQVYRYEGTNTMIRVDKPTLSSESVPLVEFHQRLRTHADAGLKTGLIFSPVKWITRLFGIRQVTRANLKHAQQQVFEHSVVQPLVENTRRKMLQENPMEPAADKVAPTTYQREALKALLRLQAESIQAKPALETNLPAVADKYLLSYLLYLTEGTNLPRVPEFAEVFFRTYFSTNSASWPPKDVVGGNTLTSNPAIGAGLKRFFSNTDRDNMKLTEQLGRLQQLRDAVVEFEKQEQRWHDAADKQTPVAQADFGALDKAKTQLDAALKASGWSAEASNILHNRQAELEHDSKEIGSNAMKEVSAVMDGVPQPRPKLFKEVDDQLTQFQKRLSQNATMPTDANKPLAALDAGFLNSCSNGERLYAFRFGIYSNAFNFQKSRINSVSNQVDSGLGALSNLLSPANAIRDKFNDCAGPHSNRLVTICEYLLKSGEENIARGFVQHYGQHVSNRLNELTKQVQLDANRQNLAAFFEFAAKVTKGLGVPAPALVPDTVPKEWLTLRESIRKLLDSSKAKVFEAFVDYAQREITRNMYFPISTDTNQPLNLPAFRDAVTRIREASACLPRNDIPPDQKTPVETAEAALKNCQAVLEFLEDTKNSLRTCTVEVRPQSVTTSYPYVAVSENGQAPRQHLYEHTNRVVTSAPLAIDKPLVLTLATTKTNTPEVGERLPQWGVLRLLAPGKGQPDHNNRKIWEVEVPLGTNTLNLRLLFQEPLPDEWPLSKDWPTR